MSEKKNLIDKNQPPPVCPHCDGLTVKMSLPLEAGYDTDFFYVCFNDECPYFIRGKRLMWEKYRVQSSYRYRVNPVNGKPAPLPVWSKDAMKNHIIKD